MRSSSQQSQQSISSSDELSIHIDYCSPEIGAPNTRVTITPQSLALFKNYKPSTTPTTSTMGRAKGYNSGSAYYSTVKSNANVPSK